MVGAIDLRWRPPLSFPAPAWKAERRDPIPLYSRTDNDMSSDPFGDRLQGKSSGRSWLPGRSKLALG